MILQDLEKAVYWWTKAAEQGVAEGQYLDAFLNLATYYNSGYGAVETNLEKAVYWCSKGAEL